MMKLPRLNLLTNLLLLHQLEEWVNTEIQLEESVNNKIMRLLYNLLLLLQSEEWVITKIMRSPRFNPFMSVYTTWLLHMR